MIKPNYLRISVTPECNSSCIYCKPKEKTISCSRDLLTAEELEYLVNIFVSCGIDSVRLTGGEPLLRDDLIDITKKIATFNEIKDLSLTTNGILLRDFVFDLKKAGLKRLNVSLNSLNKETFYKITGLDLLENVLSGIEIASQLGFNPIKINSVVLKNINEDEIFDLARLSINNPILVRFIEYSPLNKVMPSFDDLGIVNDEVKNRLEKEFGKLSEDKNIKINGPAKYYKIKNSLGNIGFISGFSQFFCSSCNRLRLTSSGKLLLCLYAKDYLDLKSLIRRNTKREVMKKNIEDFISRKYLYAKPVVEERELEMSCVGG
ncbi:MAG: GTP 3',8-cyclase MoaA [Candidatus Omnitrophota bacterium]